MGNFTHMTLPWTDIPIFLSVARGGSLSAAARFLKLDRTTVSRRLDHMERQLNESLFVRDDGNFVLTAYGHKIFSASENAERELLILDKSLQNNQDKGGGNLKVSMSEHLLITLAPCFKDFGVNYPDIRLDLSTTDRSVDLHHFEADVILRITRGSLSKLESRYIGKPIYSIYRLKAAPDVMKHYLSRPNETKVPKFVKQYAPDAKIRASIDGVVSMREMILQGAGIGILPNYFGDLEGRIEKCSDALPSLHYALYIAYLPERRRLPRLKMFTDFVQQYLKQMDGFEAT